MPGRPAKITFGDMRDSGVRELLVYCSDYRCRHSVAISGDGRPDEVRLSDIEPRFVCAGLRQLPRRGEAGLQLEQKTLPSVRKEKRRLFS